VAGFKVTTEVTANQSMTGLATFRATMKKYPDRDRRKVLSDLAASSGDPGVWFAAAKGAGLLDLAVEFARAGRTDPRTLSRAARDFWPRTHNSAWRLAGWRSSAFSMDMDAS